MKNIPILVCLVGAGVVANYASAYPTTTHAVLTNNAVNKSNLVIDPTLLGRLGIDEFIFASPTAPFDSGTGETGKYAAIDVPISLLPSTYIMRSSAEYEDEILKNVKGAL